MSILHAALKHTPFDAAREYLASGVSIIPLKGKISALKSWAMAQQYRASSKVLYHWHHSGLLSGVGVVCGAISGNLVVLDFDSQEAVADFELTFPDCIDTLIVSSGSRRGAHYYFYSKQLPSSLLVKNHELRANGLYVVAPPSPHPSGNLYEVSYNREPMRLDNMDEISAWIKSKRPKPAQLPQMSSAAAPHKSNLSREAWFRDRYVETALFRQCGYVRLCTDRRNEQLYRSAVALGQIIGAGALARARVETELFNAAMACGLEQNEIAPTIKSGIDDGEQRPRQIPPPPAPRK